MSGILKKEGRFERTESVVATRRAEIRMWHPHIREVPVNNSEQLLTIINCDFPGIRRHRQFPCLLANAECHLALCKRIGRRKHLSQGEIARLSREFGRFSAIQAYVKNRRKPRLYCLIDSCLSKAEARDKLAQVRRENNGIDSVEDLERRLRTYYPTIGLDKAPSQQRRVDQVRKYFEALKRLEEGGSCKVIASELGSCSSQIWSWVRGKRPWLLELAIRVPRREPGLGNKWLPQRMSGSFHPEDFIHVPTKVTSWSQVAMTLKQIRSLKDKRMRRWQQRLGEISEEEAFAYLMGMMVSDASKCKPSFTSTRVALSLSMAYRWSWRLGEATCYYLGKLGIETKRDRNREHQYEWRSRNSPLITWIIESCLGLGSEERTTYDPIRAKWILKSPPRVRLRFMQGLNDGDGCASIRGQFICNSCGPNAPLIEKLLAGYQIDSFSNGMCTYVIRQESVIRAAELPFFLHAAGRQASADKLAQMMRIRRKRCTKGVPVDLRRHMMELRQEGKSLGEIAEKIYMKYGLFLGNRRISECIRRHQSRG